jgi:hypothetical protein
MRPVLGSYVATTEAVESLIAQLRSQGKLTTPRCENQKIRHEIEILKANEHSTHVYKLQIYRMTPKNNTTKSCETSYPFKLI